MAGFKTKARAIDILGEKQIADDVTAISELFKNAHDADATRAVLAVDTASNSLLLWDDGHGMSYADVIDKWLTIGTDSKLGTKDAPVRRSPRFKRVTMGEKGIGRLAIAALGRQMLMVTRKTGHPWVAVYLHWGVFENGGLFLEETVIPVGEIANILGLPEYLADLKGQFRLNVTRTDKNVQAAWHDYPDLAQNILADLSGFDLSHPELPVVLDNLVVNGSGTLFLVTGLKEQWKQLAAADRRPVRVERKLAKLQVMMSTFANPLELLSDTAPGLLIDDLLEFKPSLTIDGQEIIHKEAFEHEDLSRFDFGLEGSVDDMGVFTGCFLTQGEPAAEVTSLALTAGIEWSEDIKRCGPFHLRLYFVEGTERNTRLDPGVWRVIDRKIDQIGGFYLYRDGLRVLPYGSKDFDFLEWEERRTRNAGRWPLSMRRVFGYVAVSKITNPNLQDKSSREGLRSNPEYEFFLTVLDHLIGLWVTDHLNPKRQENIVEAKVKQQLSKQQEAIDTQWRKDLKAFLQTLEKAQTAQRHAIEAKCEQLTLSAESALASLRANSAQSSYPRLVENLQTVDKVRLEFEAEISRLAQLAHPPSDTRFLTDQQVQTLQQSHSDWVSKRQDAMIKRLTASYQATRQRLELELQEFLNTMSGRLERADAEQFILNLQQQVDHAFGDVADVRSASIHTLEDHLESLRSRYDSILKAYLQTLTKHRDLLVEEYRPKVDACFDELHSAAEHLNGLLSQFNRAEGDVKDLASRIQSGISELQNMLSAARQKVEQINQVVEQAARIPAVEALETSRSRDPGQEDWAIMGHLNNRIREMTVQMEQYRHLASTGIAAEVVNHEFDEQYRMLHRLFARPAVKKAMAKVPELESISILFEHLESRHRLLSPLYMRTRMLREPIALKEIGNNAAELFVEKLEQYDITFTNDIPADFVIVESESIVYPVFVNVINNSIFWLLDNKQGRNILLRGDSSTGQLYIEDNGPGIPPDRVERVFELFYSTRPEGRGIGLNLVQELLSSRNHTIEVVTDPSEKQLAGACFRIQFAPEAIEKKEA